MSISNLPKIELHLHLDCSLSYKLVCRLRPETTLDDFNKSFIAPPKCTDLADYIKRAISAIELMQTEENLGLVVQDLFEQLQKDHIIYAEVRFAPLEHTQFGLTPEQVVATVNRSLEEAIATTGIQAGLILCTLRHYTEAQSMETVELVRQFAGTRVVGFDIAADEAGFPIDNHIKAFKYAREHKLNCTAHAGEARGPDSMWESLEHFRPARIGHGVRAAEDPALLEFLKEHHIHLEVCPTSNIQTDIFETIGVHSIDYLYQAGISMSVNTDCRTISNVNLSSEYQLLEDAFGWGKEHFYKCNCEAIKHAFISDTIKEQLLLKIQQTHKQ